MPRKRLFWAAQVLFLMLTLSLRGLAASAPDLLVDVRPRTASPGVPVTITITVTNPGPAVSPFNLRAHLPPELTYIAGTARIASGGSPPAEAPPEEGDGELRWNSLSLPPGRTGNIRGINTFVQDHCEDPALVAWQLDRARDLVGEGGVVKQLVMPITLDTRTVPTCWVEFVWAAYRRGLDPILRLQGKRAGNVWLAPDPRGPYAYADIATRYRDFVAALPRVDGRTLYIQVWNEPNRREEWGGYVSPEAYARFFSAVADAIHSLGDPRIRVLNAPLAPAGDYDNLAFMDAMFTAVPESLWKFDLWAAHAYPGNRPPEYNHHDGTARAGDRHTIDAYVLELERLAEWGRPDVRVILSETGYALGDASFSEYPPIDEWNRAEYMRRAFADYWSRWPEIVAVAPFQLSDPDRRWSAWDWIAPYGAPHPQYTAVAHLSLSDVPGSLSVTFQARVSQVTDARVVYITARGETDAPGWLPLTRSVSLLLLPTSTPTPCVDCTPAPSPTPTPLPTLPPLPTPTPAPYAHILGTWSVGGAPQGLALDPRARRLFVANSADASITILDAEDGSLLKDFFLPGYWGMHNLAWWDEGQSLVVTTRLAGATLLVPPNAPENLRFLSTGEWPTGLAIAPEVGRAFVSNAREDNLAVIDLKTWTLEASIPTGRAPAGVAYDPRRGLVVVVNSGDNSITLVNARDLSVAATVAVGGGPYGVAVDARRGIIIVADREAHALTFLTDANRFEVPVTCVPRLVDTNPALGHFYVLCEDRPILQIWQTAPPRPLLTLPVAGDEGLLVDRWARRVYVSNSRNNTVTIVQDTPYLDHYTPGGYLPLIVQ